MSILLKQDFNAKNLNLAAAGWVTKGGGVPDVNIIVDPKDPNNSALSFKRVIGYGDIYSPAISSSSGNFLVCGRYLSIDKAGADPLNSGGFVGYSWGNNPYSPVDSDCHGSINTGGNANIAAVLKDNREWNDFEFSIVKSVPIHLMLEDGYGVPGDAIFDDLVVIDPKGGGISSCSDYWSQLTVDPEKIFGNTQTCPDSGATINPDSRVYSSGQIDWVSFAFGATAGLLVAVVAGASYALICKRPNINHIIVTKGIYLEPQNQLSIIKSASSAVDDLLQKDGAAVQLSGAASVITNHESKHSSS